MLALLCGLPCWLPAVADGPDSAPPTETTASPDHPPATLIPDPPDTTTTPPVTPPAIPESQAAMIPAGAAVAHPPSAAPRETKQTKKFAPAELQQIYKFVVNSQRLCAQNRKAEAKALLMKAAAFDPSPYSMDIHYSLGVILNQGHDRAGALKQFDTALHFRPSSPELVLELAKKFERAELLTKAVFCYQQYVRYFPKSPMTPRLKDQIERMKKAGLDASAKDLKAPDYLKFGSHTTINAWSYEDMPLKVFIASGNNIQGYHEHYRQFIIQAFDEWSVASDNKVSWKLVGSKGEADIICDWVSAQSQFPGGDEGNTAGITYLSYSGVKDHVMHRALIQIWTMYLGDDEIKACCLHEVGHALGLEHSPSNSDNLYCALNHTPVIHLSSRDKATIKKLYTIHPASHPQKDDPLKRSFTIEYAK
jgi:predicted Zn-dependent protease